MTSQQRFTDHDIIQRYTDQPSRLPDALRTLIRGKSVDTRQLVAYALAPFLSPAYYAEDL